MQKDTSWQEAQFPGIRWVLDTLIEVIKIQCNLSSKLLILGTVNMIKITVGRCIDIKVI